jgi:TM2 domain-containing membrane protein YozV
MDCVNHIGVSSTAYCQNCGQALCSNCVRTAAAGQVLCEPCWRAWQSYQQPFIAPVTSGPNPSAAAALGLIPGVGAMYNGQFLKAFIHVIIFAALISMAEYHGIFGLFIAAWILYQSFEAYHTAKALRDGQPPPDPFGLNEVGSWLNLGTRPQTPGQPGAGQGPVNPGFNTPASTGQGTAGTAIESYEPPVAGYKTYPTPGQAPFTPPAAGFPNPAAPPPAYIGWQRNAPVGAVVLIALGTLFLLAQLDIFQGRLLEFAWPVLLIGMGIWLIVRRLEESHGGSK